MANEVVGGIDPTYIIPSTLSKSTKGSKKYFSYVYSYSNDDRCYYSLTLTPNKKPKSNSFYVRQVVGLGTRTSWYRFTYRRLKALNEMKEASEIDQILNNKRSKDARTTKWVDWIPSTATMSDLHDFVVEWENRAKEDEIAKRRKMGTKYVMPTKCNAPPPERNFSCRKRYQRNKGACEDLNNFKDNGRSCSNVEDENCLPECYFNLTTSLCDDLPENVDARRKAKFRQAPHRYSEEPRRKIPTILPLNMNTQDYSNGRVAAPVTLPPIKATPLFQTTLPMVDPPQTFDDVLDEFGIDFDF
jgi:hypothetical protein